jgi:hypothetical protein
VAVQQDMGCSIMKTPEELAEDHANMRCPEQGPEFIVWCMCKDDFLAGFIASVEQRLNQNTKNLLNYIIKLDLEDENT